MPRVSIVIPTNRPQAVLEPCLRALARQEFEMSAAEVLVVYNGPGVPPSWAADAWPFELITERTAQASASISRNVGLDRARGQWVLLLNDDVLPEPGLVAAHLAAHGHLDRPAMVLGDAPWQRYPDETVLDRMIQTTSMFFFYHRMKPHAWYNFRHAWTLNLSVARRYLQTLRFDERMPFYFEDIELGFRLERQHGLGLWYAPEAVAVHEHRHTLDSYLKREFNMGRFALRLWNCNPDCFRAIYGVDLDDAYLDYARRFVDLEGRSEAETRGCLQDVVAGRLEELCASPQVQTRIVQALYWAHLPLKRLAFRRGLLDAVEQERQGPPAGPTGEPEPVGSEAV